MDAEELTRRLKRAAADLAAQPDLVEALDLAQRHEEQFAQALESRSVIGQALGIVMERYGLDADRAFAVLARVASETNTKLRLVAEYLVEHRALPE